MKRSLHSSQAGAFTSFEGLVRNHNEGRKVIALEYEADKIICEKEFKKISQEAFKTFDIISLKCIHRTGKLKIGEMAVWVDVSAGHRDAAFKACRFIIDELKKRLPIWKKEYYANGDSGWINCDIRSSRKIKQSI